MHEELKNILEGTVFSSTGINENYFLQLEKEEEKRLKEGWSNLIILPFDDIWKNKDLEHTILNFKQKDISKQLSNFFKNRFLIETDLTSKFDIVLKQILEIDFFFLEQGDIRYNLDYLFKSYYKKEERETFCNIEDIFHSIARETREHFSDKSKSWRKMCDLFELEFNDINFKNHKIKTKFDGFNLPTACDFGFEKRMSFKNINYWINEQGLTIERVIFCTTAVYIMSIIEIKQAILFKQYGEELLKNISKDSLLTFLLNLNNLKILNKIF